MLRALMRGALARIVVAAALLAVVPACREADAAQAFARRARDSQFVTTIVPQGDSITFGVNAQTRAGWRELMYQFATATTDQKLYFAGTQSFAGNSNGLTADPFNEGRPGWVVKASAAQVPPASFGSLSDFASTVSNRGATVAILAGGTNDIASNVLNDSAAATASSISTWLDAVWANRTTPRFQIVLFAVLKRLDADDTKVQQLNALMPDVAASKSYWQNIIFCSGMYSAIVRPVVGQGYNDVVHPNDEGYDDMARAGWPCVQRAIAAGKGRHVSTRWRHSEWRVARPAPWRGYDRPRPLRAPDVAPDRQRHGERRRAG